MTRQLLEEITVGTTTITVSSRPYVDYDDHPELAGWDLSPEWADEDRTEIALSVPAWAVTQGSE